MEGKNRLIMPVPELRASIVDIVIIAVHQSRAYWNDNLNKVNEGNPIGTFFMKSYVSGLFILSGI